MVASGDDIEAVCKIVTGNLMEGSHTKEDRQMASKERRDSKSVFCTMRSKVYAYPKTCMCCIFLHHLLSVMVTNMECSVQHAYMNVLV